MINEFKKITGVNLTYYFSVSTAVITSYSKNTNDIIRFVDPSVQKAIFQLRKATNEIFTLFHNHKSRLLETQFFELLDSIETIDNLLARLQKIKKWGKFFKNSLIENQVPEINHIIRQGETLERIASSILGSNNPNDDWFNIALNNALIEEDYTSEGGVSIKLPLDIANVEQININSVIDVIDEQTIMGKDIYKTITFENDDLKTVEGFDCAFQAVEILSSLRQGDNTDFPNRGIQAGLFVGSSTAFLNYPTLLRQLNEVFSNDDTLTDFNILDLKQEEDNVYIDFEVYTRTRELISKQLQF